MFDVLVLDFQILLLFEMKGVRLHVRCFEFPGQFVGVIRVSVVLRIHFLPLSALLNTYLYANIRAKTPAHTCSRNRDPRSYHQIAGPL